MWRPRSLGEDGVVHLVAQFNVLVLISMRGRSGTESLGECVPVAYSGTVSRRKATAPDAPVNVCSSFEHADAGAHIVGYLRVQAPLPVDRVLETLFDLVADGQEFTPGVPAQGDGAVGFEDVIDDAVALRHSGPGRCWLNGHGEAL